MHHHDIALTFFHIYGSGTYKLSYTSPRKATGTHVAICPNESRRPKTSTGKKTNIKQQSEVPTDPHGEGRTRKIKFGGIHYVDGSQKQLF